MSTSTGPGKVGHFSSLSPPLADMLARMGGIEPDDDLLLELGRLTWATIILEDVTYHVRRMIAPVPTKLERGPASAWVSDALQVLKSWPPSQARDNGAAWFRAAQVVIENRNSVLHGVPVVWMQPLPDGGYEQVGQRLQHVPRKSDTPVRSLLMTASNLEHLRRQAQRASADWTTIALALTAERGRIDAERT